MLPDLHTNLINLNAQTANSSERGCILLGENEGCDTELDQISSVIQDSVFVSKNGKYQCLCLVGI